MPTERERVRNAIVKLGGRGTTREIALHAKSTSRGTFHHLKIMGARIVKSRLATPGKERGAVWELDP